MRGGNDGIGCDDLTAPRGLLCNAAIGAALWALAIVAALFLF
jgi:hypothetical protein